MKKPKRLLTALLLFTLLGAAAITVVLLNPGWHFRTGAGHAGEFGVEEAFDRDRVNIALLGFDRTAARDEIYSIYRPDTIMIASIDFRGGDVSVMNMSRDSYVRIAGTDIYDKINHAYMYGHEQSGVADPHRNGIETTLRTIEDFLGGIRIHYYVYVEMDGAVQIVDRVGGIDYEVEQPVRADFGRGSLLVDQGYQRLDGRRFLHYVRDRSVDGDTGRSRRQQQILIAALEQLKKRVRPGDILPLYRAWRENTETNLSPLHLASLALFGLRVDPGTIKTYVFPGTVQFAPRDGLDISYIVIDEAARVELIREIFGVSVAARPQIVLPGPRLVALKAAGPPSVPVSPEPETPAADKTPPPADQAPKPPPADNDAANGENSG